MTARISGVWRLLIWLHAKFQNPAVRWLSLCMYGLVAILPLYTLVDKQHLTDEQYNNQCDNDNNHLNIYSTKNKASQRVFHFNYFITPEIIVFVYIRLLYPLFISSGPRVFSSSRMITGRTKFPSCNKG